MTNVTSICLNQAPNLKLREDLPGAFLADHGHPGRCFRADPTTPSSHNSRAIRYWEHRRPDGRVVERQQAHQAAVGALPSSSCLRKTNSSWSAVNISGFDIDQSRRSTADQYSFSIKSQFTKSLYRYFCVPVHCGLSLVCKAGRGKSGAVPEPTWTCCCRPADGLNEKDMRVRGTPSCRAGAEQRHQHPPQSLDRNRA